MSVHRRGKDYLLSLPERIIRSVLGLGAGMTREVGEIVVPDAFRQGRLYQNLVDTTLRFLIEQVGGIDGTYAKDAELPDRFLARRTAGNAIEMLGIVAFRASPVWVLAAFADVCGLGRQVIPEIADALKAEGLLERTAEFTTVDQLLDGLERTSSRLATAINTPPLDVGALRAEWSAFRDDARTLPRASLPSREAIAGLWSQLKRTSAGEDRSIFETSSAIALSAVRAVPGGVRRLAATARVGTARTSQVLGAALLDHYKRMLTEMQTVGYLAYAGRQLRPYLRGAVDQFSPERRTLTQRLMDRIGRRNRSA